MKLIYKRWWWVFQVIKIHSMIYGTRWDELFDRYFNHLFNEGTFYIYYENVGKIEPIIHQTKEKKSNFLLEI